MLSGEQNLFADGCGMPNPTGALLALSVQYRILIDSDCRLESCATWDLLEKHVPRGKKERVEPFNRFLLPTEGTVCSDRQWLRELKRSTGLKIRT